MLLLLLCVRSVPKDEEDQASLNGEGRFVPRGERRGRGF